MRDPYTILGVAKSADAAEIKKAYRKLAKKYHPDQSKDPKAKERFSEANSAYEILGDEVKRGQFDRGVDVVFAAAGATGIGVLQAAKDAGKLSIGVDSNQNHLHPGSVLPSMVKRVDVAAYDSFKEARDGSWKPGLSVLGLKEGAIDWALDDNNAKLITPDMKRKVDAAKAGIIDGTIKVTDYMASNSCTF